jgi:threonyl-tRNA synthetase
VQVRIATVGDEQASYADEIYRTLRSRKIRVENDKRNEKLGLKVREAQLAKIPYLLVVGKNEAETGTVARWKLGGKKLPPTTIDEFLHDIAVELDPHTWREVERQ